MSTRPLSSLSDHLARLIEDEPRTIRARVAEEALSHETPEGFFQDLLSCGCASSLVGSLIYYADTHAFFDRHYDEIEELRDEWKDNTGMPLDINGDLKNFLAWFAFEETAYRMIRELEDEGLRKGLW